MGRTVYLSDEEVRVANEALNKWIDWASENVEDWEIKAYDKLNWKLWEEDE